MLYDTDFNSCKYIFLYGYIFTFSVQYKVILTILEKIDGSIPTSPIPYPLLSLVKTPCPKMTKSGSLSNFMSLFTKVLPCLFVPLQLEKQTTHNTKIAKMYFIFFLSRQMFSCIEVKTAGHSFYTCLCLCLCVLCLPMLLFVCIVSIILS